MGSMKTRLPSGIPARASAWVGTTVITRAPCHRQNTFTSLICPVGKEALRGSGLFPNEACVREERTQASQGKGTAGVGDAGDGRALVQRLAAEAPHISQSVTPQIVHGAYQVPGSVPGAVNDGAWTLTFWKAQGLRRQPKPWVKCLDLEFNCPGLNPSFVTYRLCDLKRSTTSPCFIFLIFKKV